MSEVSIIDVASYLPPTRVGREYFERYSRPDDPLLRNPMFRAPMWRRYAAPDQTGADLAEAACLELASHLGQAAIRDVDVLVTYTGLPDVPFLGAGAEIARRLGCRPDHIIDLHNGHCAVFPVMLDLVRPMLAGGRGRTALLCVAQNVGTIFTQPGVRTSAHASVPGDGAAAALVALTSDTSASPILATRVAHFPEYAPDVSITTGEDGRRYWQPGVGEMDVAFDNMKARNIIERGTQLVPDVVSAVCDDIGVTTADIDLLFTNQPNRLLLRNWSRALDLDPKKHLDTFDDYGNLFGAGIPITLEHAVRDGVAADDSLLMFGAFAAAGELAAAAAVHWRPGDSPRALSSATGGTP